jgi:hypothetical protein
MAADGRRPERFDVATGQPFAFIRIPAFGQQWRYTFIQGTALAQLNVSPGHVPGTQWPGQLGNFAVAGHRVTAGNPFWSRPSMKDGDLVYIQTRLNNYTYRVTGKQWGGADRHGRARPGARASAAAAEPAADLAHHLRPGLDRHPPGDRHRCPGRGQAPLDDCRGASMYAWIWHRLPGRTPARAGVLALLIVAVLAALWFYVFPWAALHLPIDASGFSG